MKVLVTGALGQLGQCLTERLQQQGIEFVAYSSSELDITDAGAVNSILKDDAPDVVINAAAYTAVDKAEREPEAAYLVNSEGAKNLAKVCSELDTVLIHVSTDYVFDGMASRPYLEIDPTSPLGVYGASKLSGEKKIAEIMQHYIVVRTAWVFSEHGSNFFKTMVRLASGSQEVSVVDDQVGAPTYAGDLADGLIKLAKNSVQASFSGWGVYHYCGDKAVSWFDFAAEIFSTLNAGGERASVPKLRAIGSDQYVTEAKRPSYSVLSVEKLAGQGVYASDWRAAVKDLLA